MLDNEVVSIAPSFFASSQSAEWFTPPDIVQRVIQVLGTIGLDPCSNSREHPNIPATRVYTQADDGLAQPWGTKAGPVSLYMNPPFGRGLEHWVRRLLTECQAGHISQAICLVPNSTDTRWFQDIWKMHAICFASKRLSFLSPEGGAQRGNTAGSVLAYWGAPRLSLFFEAFTPLGKVIVP